MKKNETIKSTVLALAAVSLLIAAIGLVMWSGERKNAGATTYSNETHYEYAWVEGQRYRYELAFQASESLTPAAASPSASVRGESLVNGELVIRSYGRKGVNYVLGFELGACNEARVSVAGHSVVASVSDCEELLQGYEVFAEITSTGEVVAVYDVSSAEDTRLASHFLHGLLTELQVVVGAGPSWAVMQTSTRGRALNHYERTGAARARTLSLSRNRSAYEELRTLPTAAGATTSVAANAAIKLAEGGYLESFQGNEVIAVEEDGIVVAESSSEVTLRFLGSMPAARTSPVLADAHKRGVGELSSQERMRTLLLEQRAGTMTQEQLMSTMARYGNGGTMPNHAQFMWSVTGFLELHPEACEPFAALFASADASPKQRALLADILAQVHHPEAQRVLVDMLSTPAAISDPRFIRYFQSLAVNPNPTSESIAFASEQLGRAQGSEAEGDQIAATAAAFVLGGMRNHVAESNPTAAAAIDESLLRFVDEAKGDLALSNALRALGNSRAENHVDVYNEYLTHASPTVRRSAARALGRTGAIRSTALLLRLAKDENARVQSEALDALQALSMDANDLIAMGDFAAAGRMHWHNHGPFVKLIERNLARSPDASQLALEAILAAPNLQSADARAAAHRLLDRLL